MPGLYRLDVLVRCLGILVRYDDLGFIRAKRCAIVLSLAELGPNLGCSCEIRTHSRIISLLGVVKGQIPREAFDGRRRLRPYRD